jgi:hypothetical protein
MIITFIIRITVLYVVRLVKDTWFIDNGREVSNKLMVRMAIAWIL